MTRDLRISHNDFLFHSRPMQGITAQRFEKPKSLSPIKRPGGSFPHVTRELSERKASKTSSAAPISDFLFLARKLVVAFRAMV